MNPENLNEPRFITGAVMQYDWGLLGSHAAVASLSHKNTPNLVPIDEAKPYAELWFGTHEKGVNYILPTVVDGNSVKCDGKAVSGYENLSKLTDTNIGELPFLFKILSINSALSLQAHPDATLAKILHAKDPVNYKDPNHKPELVIALTDMTVLCGFRPISQIGYFLKHIPELLPLVSETGPKILAFLERIQLDLELSGSDSDSKLKLNETASTGSTSAASLTTPEVNFSTDIEKTTEKAESSDNVVENSVVFVAEPSPRSTELEFDLFETFFDLKNVSKNHFEQLESFSDDVKTEATRLLSQIFEEIMLSSSHDVNRAITSFQSRCEKEASTRNSFGHPTLTSLILTLAEKYPGDVGVLCPFFLNYFSLSPNESVFLGPNIPHAYLSGQCIEAMACSDNVVRAGLTPKFRDVETLCTMLLYNLNLPAINTGIQVLSNSSKRTRMYAPPSQFHEFMVLSTQFTADERSEVEDLQSLDDGSILLSTLGDASVMINGTQYLLEQGNSLFIPSHVSGTITSLSGELKLFRCSANSQ